MVAITDADGVKVKVADAIVSVAVARGTKPNTWDVSITPLKPGVQEVMIDVADIFGVEAEEDIKAMAETIAGGDVVAATPAMVMAPIVFTATVNTPPTLGPAMPDKILVHDEGDVPLVRWSNGRAFTYTRGYVLQP